MANSVVEVAAMALPVRSFTLVTRGGRVELFAKVLLGYFVLL